MPVLSFERELASNLIARYGLGGDTLAVEVGSGDGRLLHALQDKGVRVLGIEPDVCTMARAWFSGVDTISAHFGIGVAEYVRNRYGSVRLLLARSMRAGSEEFARLVAGASHCLTPDGVVAIQSSGVNAFLEVRPDLPVRPLTRAA